MPLLKVDVPLLLDVLGMGSANSSSQSSSGNGTKVGVLNFGLGGTFGFPLGVALGWGVLLFISVFKKVSMGPWANSSSSSAPGNDMVRTRLVARRTSGPRALTRIVLVAGGISGEASKTCYLAANRAACVNREFSINAPL